MVELGFRPGTGPLTPMHSTERHDAPLRRVCCGSRRTRPPCAPFDHGQASRDRGPDGLRDGALHNTRLRAASVLQRKARPGMGRQPAPAVGAGHGRRLGTTVEDPGHRATGQRPAAAGTPPATQSCSWHLAEAGSYYMVAITTNFTQREFTNDRSFSAGIELPAIESVLERPAFVA